MTLVLLAPFKLGPIGCPETPATNYQYKSHNIAEEPRPHLNRGQSLISHILHYCLEEYLKLQSYYVYSYI